MIQRIVIQKKTKIVFTNFHKIEMLRLYQRPFNNN